MVKDLVAPQDNIDAQGSCNISASETLLLQKGRVAPQHNIDAACDSFTQEPVPQTNAPSISFARPFSDITNTHTKDAGCTSTSSTNKILKLQELNVGRKKRNNQSWYAGLTDEKRAEYLNKQRIARLKRKQASSSVNVEATQNSSNSIGATCTGPTSMRSPLSPEIDVLVHNQQSTQSWYARLSDERRAEYLKRQRMARLHKKATRATGDVGVPQSWSPQASADIGQDGSAQSVVTRVVDTSLRRPNLDEGGSDDWLHSNLTYVRQARSTEHIVPTSFISGRNTDPIDAYYEKERHRKKIKYSEMSIEQKDALLDRNRAYKRGKRKLVHTDVTCGSGGPSPHTPAKKVHPSNGNSHTDITGGINNEEDYDAHGIFEPTNPVDEMEECLNTSQNGNTFYDVYGDDDDECRLFSAQGNEFESYRVTNDGSRASEPPDPYDYVYKNLPTKHHVLKPVPDCVHCGAIRFQYEGPAFCCRKGKVKVFIPEVPQELRRLFTSQVDKDAKYFRQHIRYFNSHFAFTSLGVTLDNRVNTAARTGVYTFRAHGQLYHRLDHLVPDDHGPRHLQLYIYDTDEGLEHRVQRSPDLDINLVRKILRILENNPYVEVFKSLGSVPDLAEYRITLNTNITLDQRRYNAPTASQVAAMWVEGSDPQHTFDRSVVVYGKGERPLYIRAYYGCYDPLAYPLFFPGGETGWNRWLPYEGPTPSGADNEVENDNQDDEQEADDNDDQDQDEVVESRKYVSAREYYCFKLQIREGIFNIVLFGGRLFQQWIVDMYIKMETMRLDFYSKPENQKLIRSELYQGVVDIIASGETRATQIGKRIVLPRTFPGGGRDMQRRFLDAMAIVQRFGKPDYFITMTSNPYWEEITSRLALGQAPQDRPDLVARVYRAKLRSFKDLLIKKRYFGRVAAYVHVIEFQKRGLPHEHFLLIMDKDSKLTNPDCYDRVISAEIPDQKKYPVLHGLVVKHMLHGPCGTLQKNCPCMIDGECRFRYPQQFCPETQQGKDSYSVYRRRDDGRRVKVRNAVLDNRWVVPYNPGLLMRYNCHMNVEACSSIKAVKYLFKYIYKGHDCASFLVDPAENDGAVINEIRQYRDARFVTPPESIYRVCAFPLFGVSPSVLQLQLHLPNMHSVSFNGNDNLEEVMNRPSSSKTMLTEYFRMNKEDPYAQNFLYKEFPEFFRWIKGKKKWQRRRQRGRGQIGRIVYAHPAEGERCFMRVLLNHLRGATSFEDLRTVNGRLCSTFREACELMGLIETDKSLDDCLTESASFQMPYALRRLFATILVFCEPTNAHALWEKHLESMSEDYRRTQSNQAALEQMVLRDIRDLVHSMGKDIKSYGLPEVVESSDDGSCDFMREVREEMLVGVDQEHLDLYTSLNIEQKAGFDEILDHAVNNRSHVFFVDGPGGTGKTYLYKALLAKVRSLGKLAIATATSGIAASIMPGGRTAHSRFKIPIKLSDDSICNFTKQSGTAELLRRASLIIWDEVAMTKRQAVEALDRSLQDIMGCTMPFGGKVVVFGGDFRQVLPVVTRGTRAQITDATLQRSYLWEKIRKIRLTCNMRAQTDLWFSEYLLRIGNGTEETIGDDYVRLPDDIVIGYTPGDTSVKELIEDVFPSLHENASSGAYMSTCAILSTKNDHVDDLNDKMIEKFPGQETIYYSFDFVDDDTRNNYPIDFLNNLTPNGLPPHVLKLKVNCPVILLRNLDPNNGLCNGTRLMIRAFQNNAIDAEIVGGQHAGKRVFIPRIPLAPSEDISLPFKLKRKQFPIRLSFAMTINKAQGQTIPIVGIYLPEPVFSHGQLYVALSRGVSRQSTRILAKPNKAIDPTGKSTKNIVYRDVLEG